MCTGEGGDRDCTILIATDRDDEEDIALLEAARGNGHLVIAIGQGNSEAVRRGCDHFLSNRCSEPDGVLSIPGRGTAICPATGIINNIVMQSLLGEMVSAMCGRAPAPTSSWGSSGPARRSTTMRRGQRPRPAGTS